jgi:hypothetical protein
LNGNTRSQVSLHKKPKNKKSPTVEVILKRNVGDDHKPNGDGISSIPKPDQKFPVSSTEQKNVLTLKPKLQATPKTQKNNVKARSGAIVKIEPGKLIRITSDRQRFYAGVKRILIIKLDFVEEQLVHILGKTAKVRSVSSEHRTVTVELVVEKETYEVVLPIDAVDPDVSS